MKEIDWANLSFGYMKTDYNVRINFRNGAWGELEVSSDEHLNLHMAATCLHYGQEAFEGLKAYNEIRKRCGLPCRRISPFGRKRCPSAIYLPGNSDGRTSDRTIQRSNFKGRKIE